MIVKIFEEFVKIVDYKNWQKYFNKDFYDKIGIYFQKFNNHDKKFNRIYFDLKVDTNNFEVQIPEEISDFMRWFNYPIVDYQKGICRDKDGREIKIGKLLNKLGEDSLLRTYNQSKTNILKNINDLQVVLSRHPYDIMGMSTGRGWTTCHDIHDKRYGGRHLYGLQNDLKSGTIVAYLIRKSDRNIQNPIARGLINKWHDDCLYEDEHVYGTSVKEFKNFLKKWCSDFNKSNFKL